MIARSALLADLKTQVRLLEADLRERSWGQAEFATALSAEWQTAREAKRTAATYEAWLDDRVTQAAVAWVLATVFVRFCEDNELIDHPYLAGPGERLAVAIERQQAYFERHPERTDRDWILAGVNALTVSHVAAGLFDRAHNPMWTITPSHDAAKALLAFWRRRGEDAEIIHDFTDPDWGTRFLGDLYQDLSEYAKKTYALLQTPEFVEEFILDYTLEPAVDEFGLDELRAIDPTCGSGHFLLGSFHRLLAKWESKAPGVDRWELIGRALGSVHGVDKNPFAADIARFRLLVGAMRAADVTRLAAAPEFAINVAIGDSLLHGSGGPGIQAELELGLSGEHETYAYVTEDIHEYENSVDILKVGSYHVVIGNPPYITVKDRQESENYRLAYPSCYREYALSVPFAERFFKLAIRGGQDGRGAGYVGQITANSFMTREFGKKLIEEFFPTIDLTHVVDASGAYIPSHGTPTVILIGRRRWARQESTVRVIMSVRGEPSQPLVPAKGLVWSAIIVQIDDPGSESEWISVADVPRNRLASHPWSLAGGNAGQLQMAIEAAGRSPLGSIVARIGFFGMTHADEGLIAPRAAWCRQGADPSWLRDIVIGEDVRDWQDYSLNSVFFPYDEDFNLRTISVRPPAWLWDLRTELGNRATFSGGSYLNVGRPWYEWHQLPKDLNTHPWAIVFAEVATHNHFVLDRGGKAFRQSAPVIKLWKSATEDDHFALLGVLNSSSACFWLRQRCGSKGGSGIGRGIQPEQWMERYNFNSSNVREFPVPARLSATLAREVDGLAHELSAAEPAALCADGVPAKKEMDAARVERARIRGRMIALQEELDWSVYWHLGLLTDAEVAELTIDAASIPELQFGERAFEILLAQRMVTGEAETQWFIRHDSIPVEEIPQDWPEPYRRVVARRIEMIKDRRDLALIERPECKRRWQRELWEGKERAALRAWLLDKCEERALWYVPDEQGRMHPRPMTVNRLADRLRGDSDVVSVARMLAGPTTDLAEVLTEITADEHVPCLAQLRYKESGLRKWRRWEQVWDLQRQEDSESDELDIPVPPKYGSGDFLRTSYWMNRGKLDVHKERFVSYPRASPDGDNSLLLGWAGWDHREQAHSLMTLIDDRASKDGWDGLRLEPVIAALAEVMPWVRQWHSEVDPEFGTSPAQAYDTYLDDQKLTYGFSDDDLRGWKPPPSGRGRRRAVRPAPRDEVVNMGEETGKSDGPDEPEGGETTT